MKAWIVSDKNAEYGSAIIFADTRGRAISLAMQFEDTFEDCEWTDIRARRFKSYDQYYDGRSIPDPWQDDEHRIRLVKEYGWMCHDPEDVCEGNSCPAKEYCEYYKTHKLNS